jgi:TusE/DsrC/DsvC family sulfur relay protein
MGEASGRQMNVGDVHRQVGILAGKEVVLDREGFLWRPEDWTEEVAAALAAEIGIDSLNEEQWRVVRFLRDFFFRNGRAPLNRDLKVGLSMSLMELECLFPGGIKHGARRVAGLPNPRTCAG